MQVPLDSKPSHLFLLLLLFFFLFPTSKGSTHFSNLDALTTEDGLSSNYATCVVEDKSGFLWIGTSQGLNRFDGQNFKGFVQDATEIGSLSDNHISCSIKDSYGDLWVGTIDGGICKYNENGKFDCYQHDPNNDRSISDNQVWSIYEDQENRLWIGTQNGLNLFDRNTQSFIRFLPDSTDPTALPGQAVLDILEDDLGRLWISTWANGIALFNPAPSGDIAASSFIPLNLTAGKELGKNNVWTIEKDQAGRIWVGVRDSGLFLCEPSDCSVEACTADDFTFYRVMPSNLFNEKIILDVKVDQSNQLWVGSSMGIFKVDLDQPDAIQDHPTLDTKIVEYDPMTSSAQPVFTNQIYEDKNGIIWFSTKKGLWKYTENLKNIPLKVQHSRDNLPNHFTTFCQHLTTPDLIWVGQSNQGLGLYSRSKNQILPVQFPSGSDDVPNDIASIYQETPGQLWVGTLSGNILQLKIQGAEVVAVQEIYIPSIALGKPQIWSIFKDDQQRMVFATHRGLYLYEPKTQAITTYSEYDDHKTTIVGHNIFDVVQDTKGTYWIATAGGGLNKMTYQQERPSFENFLSSEAENSIKNNILFDLHLVENTLWIATQTGIQAYDVLKEQFLANPVLDNAITGQVLGITSDQLGNIWFSTDDGLYCYHTDKELLSFFNPSNGVARGLSLRALYANDAGQIFVGGLNEFNYITPEALPLPDFSNDLLITDIKLFNKSVSVGVVDPVSGKTILTQPISLTKEIELDYEYDLVTLEFSTLDYISSNRYHYAYQLVGLDEDWITAGTKNSVTYTNLSPDTYVFRVKAKNYLGVWSAPKELKIKVKKPFWQTIPFFFLCTISGIALLTFLQNRREYTIKKNNELLEQQVSERTLALKNSVQALQQKEKTLFVKNQELEKYIESNKQLENFAYIASHDLQAPLRTIKSFVRLLEKSMGAKLTDREKEFIHFIVNGTNNMEELIQALLTFSRANSQKRQIESISIDRLLQSIQADLNVTIQEENATIHIEEMPPTIIGDRIKLKQLFQNLIANGIKFSKKGVAPIVTISCRELADYWEFKVADKGIGIAPEFYQKIFLLFQRLHNRSDYEGTGIGLSLCKKLVEQHEGEIWIESEVGEGSNFFFTVRKGLGGVNRTTGSSLVSKIEAPVLVG